jgi:hypothetical protein
MPDMNLQAIHEALASDGRRDTFLESANNAAKLIGPWLQPRGVEIPKNEWPHTPAGIMASRSLASFTLKSLMPKGITWGNLVFPARVLAALKQAAPAEPLAVLERRLLDRMRDIIKALNQKRVRSRSVKALHRNMAEGNTGVFNGPREIRFFPLRDLAVRREAGEVTHLSIAEEKLADPTDVDALKRPTNEREKQYTFIEYAKGKVWRQGPNQQSASEVKDEAPDQYWVFSPEIPDIDDYALGYAEFFRRLIAKINHAEASLGQAMTYAALNVPCARPGSFFSENPKWLLEREAGEIAPNASADDLTFVDTHSKIGDWGFVANILTLDREDLARVFAMGIKDRTLNREAATTILEIKDELDSQTVDMLTSYSETFLLPMLRSELAIFDRTIPLFPDIPADVRMVVEVELVTGESARETQRALDRLTMQVFPAIKLLDPTFVVNGKLLADRICQTISVPTDDLYGQLSPEQVAMAQAAAAGGGAGVNGELDQGVPTGNQDTVMTRGGPQNPSLQTAVQPGSPTANR